MKKLCVFWAIILIFLVKFTAIAEEKPEETYDKYQKALQSGKYEAILKFYIKPQKDQILKMNKNQKEQFLKNLRQGMPRSYKLIKKKDEVRIMTLWYEGTIFNVFTNKEEKGFGKVQMLNEPNNREVLESVNSEDCKWKVVLDYWNSKPMPEPTYTPPKPSEKNEDKP
jgi:hypothetical protein